MRRTVVSAALLSLAATGIALPLTASADPGESVSIEYSVDANYNVTATATGGKPGETFSVSVLPLSSGVSPTAPATFVIEAVGNGGEIFDQVFDRYHRVVVCQNVSTCTATPTLVNVP